MNLLFPQILLTFQFIVFTSALYKIYLAENIYTIVLVSEIKTPIPPMKNKITFLLSVLVLFAFQSCTKMQNQNITVTQTVSAKISANETYTYTLPTNVSSYDFQISVSGNHSSVSAIQKDANGNLTYIYTPALNYTGADQVVLSTNIEVADSTEHHGNCSGGNHERAALAG